MVLFSLILTALHFIGHVYTIHCTIYWNVNYKLCPALNLFLTMESEGVEEEREMVVL